MMMNNTDKTYTRPKEPSQNCDTSNTWYDLTIARGLSEKTVLKYDIRCLNEYMVFPFYRDNEIVNLKKQFLKRDGKKKIIQFSPNCMPVLFGLNTIQHGYGTLHICEGEIDAMSLHEMGFKNCVSVPNGAGLNMNWVKDSFDFLSEFKEIFIIFDADDAGRSGADELLIRMPNNITKIVNIASTFKKENGDSCTDINDLLLTGNKDYVKKRIEESRDPRSKLVETFDNLTEKMLYDLDHGVDNIGSTGLPMVDKYILGGDGLRASECTILLGGAGSGKSRFCDSIMINVANSGVGVFLASFEAEKDKQSRLLGHALLGRKIPTFGELRRGKCEKKRMQAKKDIMQTNEWLASHNLITYNGAYDQQGDSIDSIMNAMEYSAKRYGCKLFVIDPISMLLSMGTEQAESTRRFTITMQKFVKKYGVHCIFVMHPRKSQDNTKVLNENDIYGSVSLFNFCNNMLSLWRFRKGEKDKAQYSVQYDTTVRLFCFKNRDYGELRDKSIPLAFDTEKSRYSEISCIESSGHKDFVITREPIFLDDFEDGKSIMRTYSREVIEAEKKDLIESYGGSEE